jgi:hypothetical protein
MKRASDIRGSEIARERFVKNSGFTRPISEGWRSQWRRAKKNFQRARIENESSLSTRGSLWAPVTLEREESV